MDQYRVLTIVTCISSLTTLGLVAVAMLPHVKQGMVVVRDVFLWLSFVCGILFVGWFVWHRVQGNSDTTQWVRQQAGFTQPTTPTGAVLRRPIDPVQPQDPYYAGNREP